MCKGQNLIEATARDKLGNDDFKQPLIGWLDLNLHWKHQQQRAVGRLTTFDSFQRNVGENSSHS